MTFQKLAFVFLIVCSVFGIMFLASCGTLSPERAMAFEQILAVELAEGRITPAQHAAALEAIRNEVGGMGWELLGVTGLNLLLSFLGIPAIINHQRGPITARKGLPPLTPTNGSP